MGFLVTVLVFLWIVGCQAFGIRDRAELTTKPATGPIREEYTNSVGMKFVRIEPGEFWMGTNGPLPDGIIPHERLRYGDYDERPRHKVTITKAFYPGFPILKWRI